MSSIAVQIGCYERVQRAVGNADRFLLLAAMIDGEDRIAAIGTQDPPVVSIVGAWILYDQELAPEQMAGGVVVLVALGAILRRQRAERALAAEAALTGDLLDE